MTASAVCQTQRASSPAHRGSRRRNEYTASGDSAPRWLHSRDARPATEGVSDAVCKWCGLMVRDLVSWVGKDHICDYTKEQGEPGG